MSIPRDIYLASALTFVQPSTSMEYNKFRPNSPPGYVVCGVGLDRFMWMDIYDIALLLDTRDICSEIADDPLRYLCKAKWPIILTIRLLKGTHTGELMKQISKSLMKRNTPKASTEGLCNVIASSKVAGKLDRGCVLTISICQASVDLSRAGDSARIDDPELARGFSRTFWGPSPTTPSLVSDLCSRIRQIFAEQNEELMFAANATAAIDVVDAKADAEAEAAKEAEEVKLTAETKADEAEKVILTAKANTVKQALEVEADTSATSGKEVEESSAAADATYTKDAEAADTNIGKENKDAKIVVATNAYAPSADQCRPLSTEVESFWPQSSRQKILPRYPFLQLRPLMRILALAAASWFAWRARRVLLASKLQKMAR